MTHLPMLIEGLTVNGVVVAGGILVAGVIAFLAGLCAAAPTPWLARPARAYIEVFRGSSALVQLYWVFYALPLLLGVRLSATAVGVLVLGLNVGAYGSEVVRGAVRSVPLGQREAAIALGLTPSQRLWRIILPQAIPAMMPPFGNLAIELLKASSLVMFITLHDVMWAATTLRAQHPADSVLIYLEVMAIFGVTALLLVTPLRLLERVGPRRAIGRVLVAAADITVQPIARLVSAIAARTSRHAAAIRFAVKTLSLIALAAAVTLIAMRLGRVWNWPFTLDTVLPALGAGLTVTVWATVVGAAIALTLGLIWAVLRPMRFVGRPVSAMVGAIRATPPLVQLFLIYYGVLPALGVNAPAFLVGSVLLGIHYSCYTAEVYRAGIAGVPIGQTDAARALGLTASQRLRHVIIPQALPRSIPALGNYIVAMFKETPLLSTITVVELLGMAEQVQADHFRGMEAFTLVGLTFLLLSLAAAALIRTTERLLPVRHA